MPSLDPSLNSCPPEERAAARAFRADLAKREAPRTLFVVGLAVLFLNVVEFVTIGSDPGAALMHAAVIAFVFFAAWAVGRPWLPASGAAWLAAATAAVLGVSVAAEVMITPNEMSIGYCLLILIAMGAFILNPQALACAALVVYAAYAFAVVNHLNEGSETSGWLLVGLTATLMSGVVLNARANGIERLRRMTAKAEAFATRDTVTGVFNRHGIDEQVPSLVALAERTGTRVFVTFVDIDGLKAANDTYGHAYGDDVIRAVAQGITASCRAGDLVARWGGDEFIVFGLGDGRTPDDFAGRVMRHLATSGIDLGRWPGIVSCGLAAAPPLDLDFDSLLQASDADMYARRRARREARGRS